MKGSILVFGGNKLARNNRIDEILIDLGLDGNKSSADVLIVKLDDDEKSLGIHKSKKIVGFLSTMPFSGTSKAIIIVDADKLTVQAQNALLKILEEPPEYASIILSVSAENILLDTVISRCKRIGIITSDNIKTEENVSNKDSNNVDIERFLGMTIGERLSWVINAAKNDRTENTEMLKSWIIEARDIGKYNVIGNIMLAMEDLENTNVNLRLNLEKLSLTETI